MVDSLPPPSPIAFRSPDLESGRDYKQDGSQPGVLGDQTEEQNLGQKGDPSKRITKEEVEEAFKAAPKT